MKVEVKEHEGKWREMFENESRKLEEIFGNELIDIHHIGSTAVRNLKAKPIIDIMPVVRHIESVDSHDKQMIEIGYEPLGEFGIRGRRFFRKGEEKRTHQIHVFQKDNKGDIERHLAVRDYLRTHPEAAKHYGDIKSHLAIKFPNDIESYVNGKDSFVKKLEERALEWWNEL